MSEGNDTALRFSLEESVWFQKGQEVAELISISLDPNITIHENEQYVTIEGALQLTGEYRRHEAEFAEEDIPSSPKFIQQVEERDEGVCDFSHQFPVDITIPNNRIKSIYDIEVEVDSFDYVLPERSCLKLTADLTIIGLYGEQQHTPAENKEEKQELEPLYRSNMPSSEMEETDESGSIEVDSPSMEEMFTPFEVEARKNPYQEEEPAQDKSNAVSSDEIPTIQANEPVEKNEVVSTEITFSASRNEESPSFEYVQEEVEAESPNLEEMESSSSSSSEEIVKKKKGKKSKKQGLSLAEFFARKQEEEDVARLKVCIVQSGDTIDLLAERYEVNVQSLLKVNQLELNQDIYEGQVLYIPTAVAQN